MGAIDIIFILVSIVFVVIVFATKSTKYHSYGLKRPDVRLPTDRLPPEKKETPAKPGPGARFH